MQEPLHGEEAATTSAPLKGTRSISSLHAHRVLALLDWPFNHIPERWAPLLNAAIILLSLAAAASLFTSTLR